VQLTWLGAAGFRVETNEGAVFLIDPFLSRPRAATPSFTIRPEELRPLDEIFLTHGRFDHAMDTPALVQQTGAIVHAPAAVCQHLAHMGVSPNSLQPIAFDKVKQIGTLKWEARPGWFSQLDSSPSLKALVRGQNIFTHIRRLDQTWPLGEIAVYLFYSEGLSLVYFGSAGWVERTLEQLQPDIALFPLERPPTPVDNIVQLTHLLQPRVIVPHHWDNYYPPLTDPIDLQALEITLQELALPSKIYAPSIGQSFRPAELLDS
jgi:L-ascorbate metabolism protein UlaG (beta-lactamase superfamily)